MSTVARNTIKRQVAPNCLITDVSNLVDSTISWNQGDLLYMDAANKLVKPLVGDSHGDAILGVAVQTVVSGLVKDVYQGTLVDAAVAPSVITGPVFGVEVTLKLKSGDQFVTGDGVYATATDAQTVSSAGSKLIGVYQGPTVTAGASTTGVCRIGCRYGLLGGIQY